MAEWTGAREEEFEWQVTKWRKQEATSERRHGTVLTTKPYGCDVLGSWTDKTFDSARGSTETQKCRSKSCKWETRIATDEANAAGLPVYFFSFPCTVRVCAACSCCCCVVCLYKKKIVCSCVCVCAYQREGVDVKVFSPFSFVMRRPPDPHLGPATTPPHFWVKGESSSITKSNEEKERFLSTTPPTSSSSSSSPSSSLFFSYWNFGSRNLSIHLSHKRDVGGLFSFL